MEDLYSVLGCGHQASDEELRQAYIKLARQHHPDKSQVSDGAKFVQLLKAWEILGDLEQRKEYDIRWREYCLVQELPIQEDVDLSDFYFDEDSRVYVYPCRCGCEFSLTEADTKYHYDIVCCGTCSLTIRVLYKNLPDDTECEKKDMI